jgi:hypothetical protein
VIVAAAGLRVYLVPGDIGTGHWCDQCQLPSAIIISLSSLHEGRDGEPITGILGRFLYCPECSGRPVVSR